MAAFDCWAEYYDLVHHGLPGEAEFYVGQAVRIGGATLELGCGTGRIAIPMAMSGVDVTGLDDSKAMLDVCRAKKRAIGKTPGKLKLVQKDMADFDLGTEFNFVAMAYRTFMHLLTTDSQRSCLAAVRRHLKDGGLLALNLWAPRPSAIAGLSRPESTGLREVGRYPIPGMDDMLVHHCASTFDASRNLLIEEHQLEEVDPKGAVLRSVTLPLIRAVVTPGEMAGLVKACGFKAEALFGDFACGPFDKTSTEMIWLLKKA